VDIGFPAGCFYWNWKKPFSDISLHAQDPAELEALCQWIDSTPHQIGTPAELLDRESLLQICLGVGYLLRDAKLIQFTEDGCFPEEVPVHITQSTWGLTEVDIFTEFVKTLRGDLIR